MHFVNGNAFDDNRFRLCVEFEAAKFPMLPREAIEDIVDANLATDPYYYDDVLDTKDGDTFTDVKRVELDFNSLGFGEEDEEDNDNDH